jgi:hypothetical protein
MTLTVYLFHHLISCAGESCAVANERTKDGYKSDVFSKNRRVKCDRKDCDSVDLSKSHYLNPYFSIGRPLTQPPRDNRYDRTISPSLREDEVIGRDRDVLKLKQGNSYTVFLLLCFLAGASSISSAFVVHFIGQELVIYHDIPFLIK